MTALRLPLVLAVLLLSQSSAEIQPSYCTSRCRFYFCPNSWGYYTVLGQTDVPFTNALCAKKMYVGIVGQTGEARVLTGGDGQGNGDDVGRVKISEWAPEGLLEKFAYSFFKSFLVGQDYPHSGVGRQIAQRNQLGYLNRTCFELPINDYQKLSWDGKMVLENVHNDEGNEETECVNFMTSL